MSAKRKGGKPLPMGHKKPSTGFATGPRQTDGASVRGRFVTETGAAYQSKASDRRLRVQPTHTPASVHAFNRLPNVF